MYKSDFEILFCSIIIKEIKYTICKNIKIAFRTVFKRARRQKTAGKRFSECIKAAFDNYFLAFWATPLGKITTKNSVHLSPLFCVVGNGKANCEME